MSGSTIERITRVPLREVWPNEAHDFTTWLEQNLDLLDDHLAVGLSPETVQRDQSAGSFAVDLVAEDDNGDTVVIENQLGRSDHDHLGKLLTYLAAFDAVAAIWIVAEPRSEHVKAVTWLNDSSPASVHLFKIEAVRIGDSPPAPLLTRIVGPSDEARRVAVTKGEKSERHRARRAFYEQLLPEAASHTSLHSGLAPTDGPYLGAATGYRGVRLLYGVTKHGTRTIVWIDGGPGSDEANEATYQELLSHREAIEEAFGQKIDWLSKEGNRSRQLSFSIEQGGWMDDEAWGEAIPTTIEAMIKLDDAVRPYLAHAVAE